MKPYRRGSRAQFSSSSTTITHTFQNEQLPNFPKSNSTQTPIHSKVTDQIQFQEPQTYAALKIQAAFRAYQVRNLVNKIRLVHSEADYWERIIQRQETVDAVRSNQQERIKINEALMGLLFRLDSVPGFNTTIRELRRQLSRRIVELQEILDAVSDTKVENWDGFLREWDDALTGIEIEACKDRGGGYELEKYCADHLGFHCLQRFLQDQ
ncbi:hypothetical protein Leryth_020130 [Lithospermum erythrorhizon]|nr:hypothetical protein Leryth_020130 [Lithospermum erythrorhizon]